MRRGRRQGSSLVLPWETRGAWLRSLVAGSARRVPVALLAVWLAWSGAHAAIERADVRRTHETIAEVHRAVDAFRLDFGRCPTSLRELSHPPRTAARYLGTEPIDAWGRALWVRCPGRYDPDGADVVSAGPSGNFLDADNVQ